MLFNVEFVLQDNTRVSTILEADSNYKAVIKAKDFAERGVYISRGIDPDRSRIKDVSVTEGGSSECCLMPQQSISMEAAEVTPELQAAG